MNISQFLKDDTGALSSYRLAFLAWSLGLLACILFVTYVDKALPKVDPSIVGLFAVAVGGKVMQSFSENK
jgi:hypothetical protein